ncbi:hypothetical protein EVAR_17933_1 [Eumeta japonica]|uniref:FLYWCH-type domain-containing protein n=1 Tax=Eumeta variegata TaxID=151549 RepID=A0A4C1V074_EUMVA|nr:hypothetical protein EVAR_17933_1 [Eumeta japonica]
MVANREPLFSKLRTGKPVIQIGQYRYHRQYAGVGSQALWYCSKNSSPRTCTAAPTTVDGVTVRRKPPPLFLESRLGRPVIQMGRYRYNKHISSVGHRALWYCTRGPVFLTSRLGRPVIQMGLYRYNKHTSSTGSIGLWYCTKNKSCKCTGALKTIDDVIVKQKPHNH